MKIIPSSLVQPPPAKGSGWAMLISSRKQVSLDTGLAQSLSGDYVDPDSEQEVTTPQYLVLGFPRDPGSSVYFHMLARLNPDQFRPDILGDEREPGLYPDAQQHREKVEAWRPGVMALMKAANDVEYSFALRIAFEMSSQKPVQEPAPQDPTEEPLPG